MVIAPFWHVFWANAGNLHRSIESLLPSLGLIALAVAGGVLLLLRMLPGPRRSTAQLCLLYLCACAWLMTNFFIGDYGFLEGTEPDWAAQRTRGVIELASFGLLAGLCYLARRRIQAHMTFLAGVLIVSSVAFFPAQVRDLVAKPYAFSKAGIFEFSASENVLVLVLDTLQADVVNEIFEGNPRLAETFSGFTFFRNSVSAFPKTYTSVPSILTGRAFDNSQPLPAFLAESYAVSLPARLHRLGYDVRLWSFTPQALLPLPGLADNIVSTADELSGAESIRRHDRDLLLNMALFRLAPHVLKPRVYNEGRFVFRHAAAPPDECRLPRAARQRAAELAYFDTLFVDEFMACAAVGGHDATFRFFHLMGGHPPFRLGREFQFVGVQPISREAFRDQSEGMLYAAGLLLERLNSLGILDAATIAIVSDHGGSDLNAGINRAQPGLPAAPGAASVVPERIVRGGIPLVMIKPGGARGPLQRSDAPVTLTDIPATLLELLGQGRTPMPGANMFAIGDDRVRLHRHYRYGGWDVDYIVPMTEYAVTGFSWYPSSWQPSTRDLVQAAVDHFDGFLVSLVADEGELDGWSRQTYRGRMLRGQAEFYPGRAWQEPMLLTVMHYPFASDESTEEFIAVSVGEERVGRLRFVSGQNQRRKTLLLGPSQARRLDRQPLRLVSERDVSAVEIQELRLTTLAEHLLPLGVRRAFGQQAPGQRYLTHGWLPPKQDFVASLGHTSGLLVALDGSVEGDVVLELDLRPYVYPAHPTQPIRMWVNGAVHGPFELRERQTLAVRVAHEDFAGLRALDVTLEHLDPVRPRSINPNWDGHLRALALEGIRVRRAEPDDG